MKKEFVKPEITYENFGLASISTGGCLAYPINIAEMQCAIQIPDLYDDLTMDDNTSCPFIMIKDWPDPCSTVGVPGGSSGYDQPCYHVPEYSDQLFNS